MVMLMEEILHHQGGLNPANNGIFIYIYIFIISTGAGFLPSTASYVQGKCYLLQGDGTLWSGILPLAPFLRKSSFEAWPLDLPQ